LQIQTRIIDQFSKRRAVTPRTGVVFFWPSTPHQALSAVPVEVIYGGRQRKGSKAVESGEHPVRVVVRGVGVAMERRGCLRVTHHLTCGGIDRPQIVKPQTARLYLATSATAAARQIAPDVRHLATASL